MAGISWVVRSCVRLVIWSLLSWLYEYNTMHCLSILPLKPVVSTHRVRGPVPGGALGTVTCEIASIGYFATKGSKAGPMGVPTPDTGLMFTSVRFQL